MSFTWERLSIAMLVLDSLFLERIELDKAFYATIIDVDYLGFTI